MLYAKEYMSPLGQLIMTGNGDDLTGLWFAEQKNVLESFGDQLKDNDSHLPVFETVKQWLDAYFAGDKPEFENLPLAPLGTEFRQKVWSIMCKIPYGEVTTYGAIAKEVAVSLNKAQMSSQAVGGAVGHNPISIILPCHRVVGAQGNLTGYAAGLDKKVWLLKHEGADMSQFFMPKNSLK